MSTSRCWREAVEADVDFTFNPQINFIVLLSVKALFFSFLPAPVSDFGVFLRELFRIYFLTPRYLTLFLRKFLRTTSALTFSSHTRYRSNTVRSPGSRFRCQVMRNVTAMIVMCFKSSQPYARLQNKTEIFQILSDTGSDFTFSGSYQIEVRLQK